MSNYHSLQLTLAGQVAHSLQMQLNYTYSRTMSDADNSTNSELSAGPQSQGDPYNIWYDYGLSSYNITQVFTGHLLYDLPLHKNAWVSGWEWGLLPQVQYRDAVQPGYWLRLLQAHHRMRASGSRRQPISSWDDCGQSHMRRSPAIHTAAHWYNPCAFMLPADRRQTLRSSRTLGDIHRNDQIGPAYMGMDTTPQKSTTHRRTS